MVISGKLAKVYFILLKHKRPMGVREVQRLAGIRSPSSAKYYLDKLVELGFAEKNSEGYIAKINKESLLSVYMSLLGSIIPRSIPYAVFSTVLIITYSILAKPPLDCIIILTIPTILLWLEGIRLIRLIRRLTD